MTEQNTKHSKNGLEHELKASNISIKTKYHSARE